MLEGVIDTEDYLFFKRNALSEYKHLYIAVDRKTTYGVPFYELYL